MLQVSYQKESDKTYSLVIDNNQVINTPITDSTRIELLIECVNDSLEILKEETGNFTIVFKEIDDMIPTGFEINLWNNDEPDEEPELTHVFYYCDYIVDND